MERVVPLSSSTHRSAKPKDNTDEGLAYFTFGSNK